MFLQTIPFFVFFSIVFFIYLKTPKNILWIILLAASYYFYMSWVPIYAGLLLCTTIITYFCAMATHRFPSYKNFAIASGIIIDLGILFIFKYFNFFSYSLHLPIPQFRLLLPIGISFYIFQSVGYMIDVYKGKVLPEKNFGIFALFVSFFPLITSGPIERADGLIQQLKNPKPFTYSRTVSGLQLFVFGLFKKLVIADNLGIIVDRIFGSLPTYKGFSLIFAVVLFSWQIYSDFSGYTDMARGVSRMLGINLVENFNMPYLATSVRDFWRRWHMSLSRWFRDYLYIPLGGNRKGILRACINTIIVFTLCGLWHGASWNYVVWGAYFGIVMASERVLSKVTFKLFRKAKFIQVVYAYGMVCISWIFFRTNSLSDILYILRYSISGFTNFLSPSYIWASLSQIFHTNLVELYITVAIICIAIVTEGIVPKTSIAIFVKKQPTFIRYTMYILTGLLIVQLRDANIKEFIYVKF